MFRTIVLLLASVLAACGMLAAAGLVMPAVIQLGLGSGAGATVMVAYLFFGLFAPGFAAGLVWGTNRGKAPRPALTAAVLVVAAVLLALGWAGVLAARFAGATLSSEPFFSAHRALRYLRSEAVICILTNVCTLWFGIAVGSRVTTPVASRRLTSASLVIALVLGGSWLWRDRLLPAYGIWHTLRHFEGARMERDYAAAAALFTPEYLARELGPPPYAPKYRQACRREQANLRSDDTSPLCFHYGSPPRVESVAGTNTRRAQLMYHYKNSPDDPLSSVRWTWDVFLTPRGRTWLIADMRLNREKTKEYWGEGLDFAQSSAGTVQVTKIPEGWPTTTTGRAVPRRPAATRRVSPNPARPSRH